MHVVFGAAKVKGTLSKFVQHSAAQDEKHEALLQMGHLFCRITVPSAVWNSSLQARLHEMVASFSAELTPDDEKGTVTSTKSSRDGGAFPTVADAWSVKAISELDIEEFRSRSLPCLGSM